MLSELISRLIHGTAVSQAIISHYAQNLSDEESALVLKDELPGLVASLYDVTDLSEAVVNFFVMPNILAQLDEEKIIPFIDIMIAPLLNNLAWIVSEEPIVTFDIDKLDSERLPVLCEKLRQVINPKIDDPILHKNYLNSLLAHSILTLFLRKIPQTDTQLLTVKLRCFQFSCRYFLSAFQDSFPPLRQQFLNKLLSLLAEAELTSLDNDLIKSCFIEVANTFEKENSLPLFNFLFLIERFSALSTRFQKEKSITPLMSSAIEKILIIALTDKDKPLIKLLRSERKYLLIDFVQLILIGSRDKAAGHLRSFLRGFLTQKEIKSNSWANVVDFLSGSCKIYSKHPLIRDELIYSLCMLENNLQTTQQQPYIQECILQSFGSFMTDELTDFKLAFALVLSTIPASKLLLSKIDLLRKITSVHESKGIVQGWYQFAIEVLLNESEVIDEVFFMFFKDFFQNKFADAGGKAIEMTTELSADAALNPETNNLADFFNVLSQFLHYYAQIKKVSDAINEREKLQHKGRIINSSTLRSLENSQLTLHKLFLKIQPWNYVFYTWFEALSNDQLIQVVSRLADYEVNTFSAFFLTIINQEYFFNYFSLIYRLYRQINRSKNSPKLPELDLLLTPDFVLNLLLEHSKEKRTNLSGLFLEIIEKTKSTPTTIARYLLVLLVIASHGKHLTTEQQTGLKKFVFIILEQLSKITKASDKIRASSILGPIKALIETQDLSVLLPVEEQQQLLEIIFSEEENSEANKQRRKFQALLQAELIQEEEKEREKERIVKIAHASKKSKKTSEPTATRLASTTTTMVTLARTSPALSNSPELPDAFLFEGIGAIHSPLNDFNSDFDEEEAVRLVTTSPILLEPISPAQKFSATEQLLKQMHRSRKQLHHEIASMQSITGLPKGFLAVIATVKSHLEELDIVLSCAESFPLASLELSTPYNQCDRAKKGELEFGWNKALSQFCWNLLCESKKQLANTETTEAERKRFTAIAAIINELSRGYFKNFDLVDMPVNQKRALDYLAAHCRKANFSIIVQGSNFTDPSHANDLDLLIIPNGSREVTQNEIDCVMDNLVKEMPLSCVRKATFFTGKIYQHPLIVDGVHHFDLNFSFKPLEPLDELNKTAEALLTCTAVLWHYPDGHAVMLPQTARSICTERPALNFLGSIQGERNATGYEATVAAYSAHANFLGYLAKNIMKFNQLMMRLDPFLTWFKEYYLTPRTPEIRPPESIRAILKYLLLKELRKRPQQTIKFIFDTQLMRALVPFNEFNFDYGVGERNFRRYFSAPGNYQFIQSPSLFLAVFFLCILLEKPPTEKPALLAKLNEMHEFCGIKLSLIVDTLVLLPNEPNQLNVWTSLFKPGAQLKELSHRDENALNLANKILSLWSPERVNLQETRQVAAQPTTTQNPTTLAYRSDRFFALTNESFVQCDSRDPSFHPPWG